MALGELRTGTENIKRSAEGNQRKAKVTPFISWKKDEAKTVHFVTPIDEVPKVLLHQFVRKEFINANGEQAQRWMTFMCRKDPAWREESKGRCYLCDVIGHKATEKYVAVAVELDQVVEGKRTVDVKVKYTPGVDKEGNDVEYPNVGLVIQGAKNFFNTLVAYSQKRDIDDMSWEVIREGEKLSTNYIFYPLDNKPSLEGLELPNVIDILTHLGSVEKYDEDLEGVTAEMQPSFPGQAPTPAPSLSGEATDLAFAVLQNELDKKKIEKY
jgi:hypothetical protein